MWGGRTTTQNQFNICIKSQTLYYLWHKTNDSRQNQQRWGIMKTILSVFSSRGFVNVKHRCIARLSAQTVCAQDTSRVALHLSSLNNHREECRGDITDQNRKKKKKIERPLSDSLLVVRNRPQRANRESKGTWPSLKVHFHPLCFVSTTLSSKCFKKKDELLFNINEAHAALVHHHHISQQSFDLTRLRAHSFLLELTFQPFFMHGRVLLSMHIPLFCIASRIYSDDQPSYTVTCSVTTLF